MGHEGFPKRVRKWFEDKFPIFAPPPDPRIEFQARQEAARRARREARADCARRLHPFVGRLLVVTDFGPDWAPNFQETKARHAADLIHEIFNSDTFLGVSTQYSHARGADGQRRQHQSAHLLHTQLRERGSNILPIQPWWSDQENWLLNITMATEATAQTYKKTPEQIGHIAMVCPFDAQESLNIRPAFAYGEAFLLADISEESRFSWRAFDLPPPPPPAG